MTDAEAIGPRCFACGESARYQVRRWVGHPDGHWDGIAWGCGRHNDPEKLRDKVLTAFLVRARRVPARDAEKLRRARNRRISSYAWSNMRDWRS